MTDELMAALKDIEHVARTKRLLKNGFRYEDPLFLLGFIQAKACNAIVRAEDPFAGREPGIHSSGSELESACHRIMVTGLKRDEDVALVVEASEGHPPDHYCYPCACLRRLRGEELNE